MRRNNRDVRNHNGERRPRGTAWIALVALGIGISMQTATLGATSVLLGDVTIQLHSARYYRNGDYTRFVYAVTTPAGTICPYWILATCEDVFAALATTSSGIEWVESPFSGLRFTPHQRNEKFYLYLRGQWGVSETQVGALADGPGGGRLVTGWIDGPSCGASSLSIEVISGADVEFPEITGPGRYPASNGTTLRVVSTAAGWILSASESFVVPDGGSEDALQRVFEVTTGPHAGSAGVSDVLVTYALSVAESDFNSLPEGTYEITITYTVTID